MKKRIRTITITGHRDLTRGDKRLIRFRMRILLRDKTLHTIYFGGALGTDTYALRKALKYRGDRSYPKLIVVVPSTLEDQPVDTRRVSQRADELIELRLGHPYQKWIYQSRNEYMVRRSTDVEAFRNTTQNYGGTYNCVRFAVKHLTLSRVHTTRLQGSSP